MHVLFKIFNFSYFKLSLRKKDWLIIWISILSMIFIFGIGWFLFLVKIWWLVLCMLFILFFGVLLNIRRRWQDFFLKEKREQNKKILSIWRQIDFLLDERGLNEKLRDKILSERPISIVPKDLINEYTMGGKIKVDDWYFNDYVSDKIRIYDKDKIDKYLKLIKKGKVNNQVYGKTNDYLIEAIAKYSIKDKKVVVFGSVDPWYESIVIYYGGYCTTIEYNKINSRDDRIEVMTPMYYDKNPVEFEVALSISSFEHDGLGRYGDKLNPNGDLDAMNRAKKMLKKNGIMFLSVPIGTDLVAWNAYRRYGPLRLPKLLEKWEVLDSFGFKDEMFNEYRVREAGLQPVFVLKNI